MTYRGHGHALTRGVLDGGVLRRADGPSTGCCKGVGGSMHFTDVDKGLLGAFAIVGAGLPVALGAAYSAKLQGSGQVAMTFCGDGATNIGTFHESLNMAAAWKVGVVFIVEQPLRRVHAAAQYRTKMPGIFQAAAMLSASKELNIGGAVTAERDQHDTARSPAAWPRRRRRRRREAPAPTEGKGTEAGPCSRR